MEKKTFVRKPYDSRLYKWSPPAMDKKAKKSTNNKTQTYCNASAYSNGEDWIVTYVYDLEIINGVEHRFAYVECGYVE